MKSTGVIRRVDELGRIVIPKEIRRTLRIKDGESLEIFVDREVITLKKYSRISNLEAVSNQLVEVISKTSNRNVYVTDCDNFIAAAGSTKNQYIGGTISKKLDGIIKSRKIFVENKIVDVELLLNKSEDCSYIASPIIVNGDVLGLVIISSEEENLTESDEQLSSICSQFLGKYVEE